MSFLKRLFGKKTVTENDEKVEAIQEVDTQQVPDEVEETIETVNESVEVEETVETVNESVREDEAIEPITEVVAEASITEKSEALPEEDDVEATEAIVIEEQLDNVTTSEEVSEEAVEEISLEDSSITEEAEELEEAPQEEKKKGFIKRLFSGLTKTRDNFLKGVEDVLSNFKHIDEDLYEELEEALIMADFGVDTTLKIMDDLRQKVKEDKITEPQALKVALQEIITNILTRTPAEPILNADGPTVILVIGVNGVGKTTSIGKMSHLYKSQGKRVLVAAADTFRAAAIEQLQVWCERAHVDIIKHEEGTDAAAVVFDAIAAAKSRKSDVLICDTAGRLQNKTNLMKELEKISRIIAREYPEAKKEILIALDATTGQNAMQQVKLFKEVAEISGIILTKLDGTAKGGAIVGIYENFEVPVKFIGVGEKIDDFQPFDAEAFAKALFQNEA